jgi:hypothetical protein
VQLELFKRQPIRRRREGQSSGRQPRLMANSSVPESRPQSLTATDATDLASLISQLEESKFVRLFRHIVDSSASVPREGADNGKPAVALDLPDAELYFKFAASVGSWGHHSAAWLFQIAHAPAFLSGDATVHAFFSRQLKRAFVNLKQKYPDLQRRHRRPDYLAAFNSASEGCEKYYLFTNICANVRDKALEEFSDAAHRLYSEIVGIPEDRHPEFGIGTPETLVERAIGETRRCIIDLLNTPSSYYVVAREGQIAVIPTTEHGAFLAANQTTQIGIPTTGLSTVVTSSLSPQHSLNPPALSDFKALIDSKHTKEQDLQSFFETNPHCFFGLNERYCEIRPHICLFDARGERLIPDFMARVEDSDIWDVIELKRPQHSLTICNDGRTVPSAAAAHAVRELLQYRDFFSIRNNREKIMRHFGTAPYEPCLVLVIGRGRATDRYEWRTALSGFPRVQIVSYDYLFQRARDCSRLISQEIPIPTKSSGR